MLAKGARRIPKQIEKHRLLGIHPCNTGFVQPRVSAGVAARVVALRGERPPARDFLPSLGVGARIMRQRAHGHAVASDRDEARRGHHQVARAEIDKSDHLPGLESPGVYR